MAEAGNLHLLAHASGIRALPAPKHRMLFLDRLPIPTDGPWSSIVKGYQLKKEAKQTLQLDSGHKQTRDNIKQLQADNVKLIAAVVKISLKDKDESAIQAQLTATYKGANMSKDVLTVSRETLYEAYNPPHREDAYATAIQIDDQQKKPASHNLQTGQIEDFEFNEDVAGWFDVPDQTSGVAQNTSASSNVDTGLVEDEQYFDDLPELQDRKKFKNISPEMDSFYKSLQYEDLDDENCEVYMFEEGKGYSFPYGRKKDMPEDLAISHETKQSDGMYVKGKDHFDDDGEFLFRTP